MKLASGTKSEIKPGTILRQSDGFAVQVLNVWERATFTAVIVEDERGARFSSVGRYIYDARLTAWYGVEIINK